uniref:DUF4974 domain-containing protein n=1 Tax=Roseihalotalea indica TaxID=2867963 RepID=A0AA49GRE5_9BACT|nr:DUF4974 domain-containing protein [Tunicatimonas sp. TK19036]
MGEPNDEIWTLVAKQLTGELTAEEATKLADWQEKRSENQATVEQVQSLWQRSKERDSSYEPDVEEGWQRFMFRRDEEEGEPRPLTSVKPMHTPRTRTLVWLTGVAASLALLVTIGYLWRSASSEMGWEQFATADGETKLLTLPDSSQVWLNSLSSLRYAADFNVNNRVVYLEGEGFFEVKEAEGKRFTIFSGPAKTEVIGTSFNLRAYQGEPVKVQVVTGRVAFSPANEDNAVFLEPGEEALIASNTEPARTQTITDPNFRAWQNKVLHFDNTSLTQIAHQMEEQYGITIELAEPALANCRYTASFDNAALEDVLTTLSVIGNLSYQQQGNHYVLTGPGCE